MPHGCSELWTFKVNGYWLMIGSGHRSSIPAHGSFVPAVTLARDFADTCCHRQEIPASQSGRWYHRSCIDVTFLWATRHIPVSGSWRKDSFWPQARGDRLIIFTLNRKDWLSDAEWLGLVNRQLIIIPRKTKTHATLSGPEPLPDRWAPVICISFLALSSALVQSQTRRTRKHFCP